MPFVRLCDFDPAFDLVALIEKMTVDGTEEKQKDESAEAQPSPLAVLVQDKNYTQMLEEGFFARIEKILQSPEHEVDASFSLCFSLLHTVDSESVSDMILRLATALSKDHTTYSVLKLRLLCQLFNHLDTSSSLRVFVFLKMLRLAIDSKHADMVLGEFRKIDQWMSDWKLPDEQTAELYLGMSQAHAQTNSTLMSKFYLLKYLKTFESADSKRLDSATEHAITAVKSAISDPTLLQCDGLLNLAVVKHLSQGSPANKQLYKLFYIFALQSISEFNTFVASEKSAFATLGLDEEACQAKMRRLSLITLAAGKTQVTYQDIQEACALSNIDEVEEVVIEAVGLSSLDAKLDQELEVVQIRRVDQRSFDGSPEAWGVLGTQLGVWSQNIASVLNHMSQQTLDRR